MKAAAGEPQDAFLAQLVQSASGVGVGPGADVLTDADLQVRRAPSSRECGEG